MKKLTALLLLLSIQISSAEVIQGWCYCKMLYGNGRGSIAYAGFLKYINEDDDVKASKLYYNNGNELYIKDYTFKNPGLRCLSALRTMKRCKGENITISSKLWSGAAPGPKESFFEWLSTW